MVTLDLTALFVNLLSSGDMVTAQSSDRNEVHSRISETKHLSGGRQRAITAAGEQTVFTFTMIDVPRSTVDTLREWAGQTVQVRDNRGRLFVGTYSSVPADEIKADPLYDVALSLRGVSAPEGV